MDIQVDGDLFKVTVTALHQGSFSSRKVNFSQRTCYKRALTRITLEGKKEIVPGQRLFPFYVVIEMEVSNTKFLRDGRKICILVVFN